MSGHGKVDWIGRGDDAAAAWVRDLQRIENVGVLAAGVAHDCNDLLTVIVGIADLMRSELTGAPNAAMLTEDLGQIREAAERAGQLTQRFLRLTSSLAPPFRSVDLGTIVAAAAEMLSIVIPPRIELVVSADRSLPPISGDPAQLRTMVLNLTLAASAGIGKRPGVVTLDVSTIGLDAGSAAGFREAAAVEPGAHQLLRIGSNAGNPLRGDSELATAVLVARRHGAGLRVGLEPGRTEFEVAFPGRLARARLPTDATIQLPASSIAPKRLPTEGAGTS